MRSTTAISSHLMFILTIFNTECFKYTIYLYVNAKKKDVNQKNVIFLQLKVYQCQVI